MTTIKIFASVVTTNGFALNHGKSLQIYFCVKCQGKNDFLEDVESTVGPVIRRQHAVYSPEYSLNTTRSINWENSRQ